ncbi:hypothetical protein [Stieleria mannarensis]|uniref:hypothetical protein n=1 Tax=Stieleria mannarensis TaxID=2755585 RepID=UPI0015FFCB2E|nr:hypothetical protein [Rhodopirellula sp. JC639]
MSRFMRWASVPALAFGLLLMPGGNEAEAGGFSIRIGNYGYGYGNYGAYRSLRPSYGPSIYYGRSFRPTYNYHRSYRGYHPSRPHYDYHPPSLVPHGNHFDYVPGHYDFHYRGHGRHGHHGKHGHHKHH